MQRCFLVLIAHGAMMPSLGQQTPVVRSLLLLTLALFVTTTCGTCMYGVRVEAEHTGPEPLQATDRLLAKEDFVLIHGPEATNLNDSTRIVRNAFKKSFGNGAVIATVTYTNVGTQEGAWVRIDVRNGRDQEYNDELATQVDALSDSLYALVKGYPSASKRSDTWKRGGFQCHPVDWEPY